MKVQHGWTTVSSDDVQLHVWAGALAFQQPVVQRTMSEAAQTAVSGPAQLLYVVALRG